MIKAPFKRKPTAVSNRKDSTKNENGTTSPSSSSVNSTIDVCNSLENAANVYAEIDVNDFLRTKTDNSVDDVSTNPDELNFIECFFNKNDSKNNFFELSNDDNEDNGCNNENEQAVEATEKTVAIHDYINTSGNTVVEVTSNEPKNNNTKNIPVDENQIVEQNHYDIDSCSSYLHMRPINELSRFNANAESNFTENASNLKKIGLSVNLPTRTINALLTTIKDKITKQEEKALPDLDKLKNSSNSSIKNDDENTKSLSDNNNAAKFAKRLKSKFKSGFMFNFSKHERICPKCSKNWSDKPKKSNEVTSGNGVMEKCCCPNENCNDHDHIDDSHYVNEHTYSELLDVSRGVVI